MVDAFTNVSVSFNIYINCVSGSGFLDGGVPQLLFKGYDGLQLFLRLVHRLMVEPHWRKWLSEGLVFRYIAPPHFLSISHR